MASGDPGDRTAPAFTAAATGRLISLLLKDKSGDTWSEPLRVPVAATAAAIEAYAAAYQDCTQATMYGIVDTQERIGAALVSNANTDQRNSVKQGVNNLFHNPTTQVSGDTRVVAPVLAVLDGNNDVPLPGSTPLSALISARNALVTGYNFVSAQYTERRERRNNPRVSV